MDSRDIQREIDRLNLESRNLNDRLKSLNSDLTKYNKDLERKISELTKANNESRIKQLQHDIDNENKRISSKQQEIDRYQKQALECQNKINKLSSDFLSELQREADKKSREEEERFKRQQADLRNREQRMEWERQNKEQAQRAEYERNRKALEKQQAEAEEQFKRKQKEFERKQTELNKQAESSRETYYEPPVYEEPGRRPGCFGTIMHSALMVLVAIFAITVVASFLGRFTGNDKPTTSQPANTPAESSVSNDSEEILGQVVVVIDELFVRSMPSTEGNTPKEFAKMDVVYNVYDIYTDDQYTWYRIGEDQWIADYNGEWVNWVEVD